MNTIKSTFMALLIVLLPYIISFSLGNIIYIPDDFLLIQEAVDNSQDNDTLLIEEGLYQESIFLYDHGITLASYFIMD